MRIIVAKIPSQIVAGNRGSKAIVTQRIRKNSGAIPEFLPAPASDFGGYVLRRRSFFAATSLSYFDGFGACGSPAGAGGVGGPK
jgi:hypothetical protein